MPEKVLLVSLGCAKNQVNSEQMLCLIQAAGMEPVVDPAEADAAVVNTCGFIDSAKMEAIENILDLAESRRVCGRPRKIIVCGCLSQRYGQELADEMPEIDSMMGTGSYNDVAEVVARTLGGEKVMRFGDINAPEAECGRVLSTGPAWAYLKIAEGCDNRCAYCVIPSLRGRYRSRPMESLLREARVLAAAGIRELIVVAQDITRYGLDLYGRRCLADLIRELARIPDIRWIRLHYLYPDEFDDRLIDAIASCDKVVKYLDIPLQHINDAILKKMNRRGTGAQIRALLRKLRERIPGLVIRTSIIAGLPGEGEAEFEELCAFHREAKMERVGVFPYSPEEGTPAEKMPRPDEDTARHRAELIEELQSEIMDEYNASRLGQTVTVLCEGFDSVTECWYGRSYAEGAEVDGRIFFLGRGVEPGDFVQVNLFDTIDGEMLGELVPEEE